jgi:hypothetical protein
MKKVCLRRHDPDTFMWPVVEISSMPPAPCTTHARLSHGISAGHDLRQFRSRHQRSAVAPAGFVSGPAD